MTDLSIVYVRHVAHDIDMPEEERMARVRAGDHHDFWSEVVACTEDGRCLRPALSQEVEPQDASRSLRDFDRYRKGLA